MSKSKLLLNVITDMRSLADSLQAVADAIAEDEPAKIVEIAASAKASKEKKKEITLEEVRAKLAEKSQAGLTAEVRKIIKKYGGSKLSEIVPEHYANILKDVEVLGNE